MGDVRRPTSLNLSRTSFAELESSLGLIRLTECTVRYKVFRCDHNNQGMQDFDC